ncbi:hypothetical protein L522_1772 [Bordetella bronchiseptica MBORD707]|nr:hypothetical protein L522_1772 [Bordetella bronchiseptica MBORD707]
MRVNLAVSAGHGALTSWCVLRFRCRRLWPTVRTHKNEWEAGMIRNALRVTGKRSGGHLAARFTRNRLPQAECRTAYRVGPPLVQHVRPL